MTNVKEPMAHVWTVVPERSSDRARVYKCGRCQAGPVTVRGAVTKSAIRKAANEAGVSETCSIEEVRKVMES
jgi:hypothetical protein